MPRRLKPYIIGVVAASVFALVATTLVIPIDPQIAPGGTALGEAGKYIGVLFWIVVCLVAQALPVRMLRGATFSVSVATLMSATILGGPTAGAWVGLLGTTEVRELRGRVPWYGTLTNRAGVILPVVAAGLVIYPFSHTTNVLGDPAVFVASLAGGFLFLAINAVMTAVVVSLRTDQSPAEIIRTEARGIATSVVGIAPLGWLIAQMYTVAWWASLLFALPLYTTRLAYHNFVEMREMFTQTITALAGAVDKRDPYTSKHSWRVKEIAGDIGRVMRLGVADLEALEWGGLLHDVGKIGVPDNVLLKQERLTREERMIMNAHPVLGAQIIAPVTRLSRELPIIRHHHEWYNGSGYPDRLIGDEIPLLARVLHVADAFEAMTAQRPYRMTPLTPEQALGELRKFAGVQFDPQVVDAFVKTDWVAGVSDPGRTIQPRPIPLISQRSGRAASPAAAGAPSGTAPIDPG